MRDNDTERVKGKVREKMLCMGEETLFRDSRTGLTVSHIGGMDSRKSLSLMHVDPGTSSGRDKASYQVGMGGTGTPTALLLACHCERPGCGLLQRPGNHYGM